MKSVIKSTLVTLLSCAGLCVAATSFAQEALDPQTLARRLQEVSQSLQKQPTPQQLNQLQQLVIQLQLVQSQLPQQMQVLEQLAKRDVQLTEQFNSLNQTLINQAGPAGAKR